MKKIQNAYLKIIVGLTTILTPLFTHAQVQQPEQTAIWDSIKEQWQPVENVYGGRPPDPRVVAANILKVLMGFLGIVFIIMIVYGGFMWMTAGGNSDRVDKAKATIRQGTIGVAIILMAFAIARFILIALGCSISNDATLCLFFHNLASF